MRGIFLTAALVVTSGSAMASSIDVIHGDRTGNGSIISISCATCPPAGAKTGPARATPSLAPGTQNVSIRDVDGKKQIVRTEAWLGGSPVTYVSSNQAWLAPRNAEIAVTETDNTIDTLVKTSAVKTAIDKDAAIIPNPADASATPAVDGLVLRPSH